MGVNVSCRQNLTSSCCGPQTSTKRNADNLNNSNISNRETETTKTPVMAKRPIPEDVKDKSGFLKQLPINANGRLLPQQPPNIQSKDGFMNIHELYNAINIGYREPYIHDPYYMLILDTRSIQQYETSHIVTARKHTAIDTDFDCLLNIGKLLQYTMVILYDEDGICDSETIQNLLARVGPICQVYVLIEGFCKFQSVYPYLCNNKFFQSEEHRKQIHTYPSVILEGCLFQGNKAQAECKSLLQDIGITHIVNVTSEIKNLFPDDFVYLRIAVEDELSTNLRPRLSQAADFIANALRHGGRVFVHCIQGVSRSSTITLSFMMKYLGWPLKEARDYLKICRPIISPNRAFILQLSNFEEKVFGLKLSNSDDVWLN